MLKSLPRVPFGVQVLVGLVLGVVLGLVAREIGPVPEPDNWLATTLAPIGSSFVALLLSEGGHFPAFGLDVDDNGVRAIIVFIAITVASDTGGYVAGVLFGKHPMAPVISPKKSWEGFAGSIVATIVGDQAIVTPVLTSS